MANKELDKDSQDNVTNILDNQKEDQVQETPEIFKKEDPKLMSKMRGFVSKLTKIKTSRSELNAESNEVMAKLENLGFSKKGCKAAISYLSLNEKDRINFDLSYSYLRKACGEPVQDDLFRGSMEATVRESQQANK